MTAALGVLGRVVLVTTLAIVISVLFGGPGGSSTDLDRMCTHSLAWDRTRDAVGRDAVVRGPVMSTARATTRKGRPTFLDLGEPSPSERRFRVVIPGVDRGNWRLPPEDTYAGREIAVRGEVGESRGIRQMIVRRPGVIEFC